MSIDDEMYDGNSFQNDLSPGPWHAKWAYLPKRIHGEWVWFNQYYWREVWGEYRAGDAYTDHKWMKEYGNLMDVLRSEHV